MSEIPESSDTTFDDAKFRQVLGHFPTGVTVVTAIHEGAPVGLAIGSFASLSLQPPLVMFGAGTSSSTWPKIREAGVFCINVLAEDQDFLGVREVPVGASCAPSDLSRPCAGQSDCVRVGADDRCVARGARGGVCRDATPGALCDAGLACRSGRCVP